MTFSWKWFRKVTNFQVKFSYFLCSNTLVTFARTSKRFFHQNSHHDNHHKTFFLTFRAKKLYIVKWFKAFCTLPFFCGVHVHLKTTTSKIHKLLRIFRENMMISRILFNMFLFLFGPRSVLDFWLSNCCNSCSMEKKILTPLFYFINVDIFGSKRNLQCGQL